MLLTITLLAVVAPLAVSSHGMNCSMPCCAGGSCSTGACDVDFEKKSAEASTDSHCEIGDHTTHADAESPARHGKAELSELCGQQNLKRVSVSLPDVQPEETSATRTSITRPCASDCCAGTTSLSSSRRPRETALWTATGRQRPRVSILSAASSIHPEFLDEILLTQSPPRAPPTRSIA